MKSIEDVNNMTPNQLVSWFLISSYAYYKISEPIMSDGTFDALVERMKTHWEEIDHYHKYLITPSHLDAGTGYDINFPEIVKYSTKAYLRDHR